LRVPFSQTAFVISNKTPYTSGTPFLCVKKKLLSSTQTYGIAGAKPVQIVAPGIKHTVLKIPGTVTALHIVSFRKKIAINSVTGIEKPDQKSKGDEIHHTS
jgi:hypothetical protein